MINTFESEPFLENFLQKEKTPFRVKKNDLMYSKAMLKHFIGNVPIYRVLVAEAEVELANSSIRDTLYDNEFIKTINSELEITSKLFSIIGADEHILLGDAAELWLKLDGNGTNHVESIERYKGQFLVDIALLAYYFNPKADRNLLRGYEGRIQFSAIRHLSKEGTKSFGSFKRLENEFKAYKKKEADTQLFWELLEADHQNLSSL